jgi:hypothetical protein
MNPSHFIKLFSAFLLLTVSAAFANEPIKELTFLKGLQSKQITLVKTASNGGYMGKCLSVSLKNNTTAPIMVKMDPALIFTPLENKYQHLVSVGEEAIVLNPGETKTEKLQTFCGKAPASSPKDSLNYKFWKQGSPEMVLASRYIREHALYSSIGQHAVWMFTNNHCLRNVYSFGPDEAKGKLFVEYLAKITHQSVPEYFTFHKINTIDTSGPVYDRQTSTIIVNVEWKGEFSRNIRVAILDENKKVYKEITDGEVISSNGDHKISVIIDPKKTPKGVYYVQLKDHHNRVWIEKYVVVGNFC